MNKKATVTVNFSLITIKFQFITPLQISLVIRQLKIIIILNKFKKKSFNFNFL